MGLLVNFVQVFTSGYRVVSQALNTVDFRVCPVAHSHRLH